MRSASNADWLPDRYSVVPVNSFHWRVNPDPQIENPIKQKALAV